MKGKIADGEARDRLIIWIRRRMEEFGITVDALAASIQHDIDHPPLYRDARGNEWNGLGDTPDWLRAAQNAGVDPTFFRIAVKSQPQARFEKQNASDQIDPRQLDLFTQLNS
jgi:DNA-binding protein H-NS